MHSYFYRSCGSLKHRGYRCEMCLDFASYRRYCSRTRSPNARIFKATSEACISTSIDLETSPPGGWDCRWYRGWYRANLHAPTSTRVYHAQNFLPSATESHLETVYRDLPRFWDIDSKIGEDADRSPDGFADRPAEIISGGQWWKRTPLRRTPLANLSLVSSSSSSALR